MAKHCVLLVTLLLSASVCAQEPPELSAIVFRIDSIASSDDSARDSARRQAAVLPAPASRPTRHVATGDLSADIEKRLAAIDAEQDRTSERSPTLIDPLQSLAAVGPHGNARNIDVLATSANTPKIIEKRLRQYLERSRFRPRFVDGQIARSDRFSARFHYDY